MFALGGGVWVVWLMVAPCRPRRRPHPPPFFLKLLFPGAGVVRTVLRHTGRLRMPGGDAQSGRGVTGRRQMNQDEAGGREAQWSRSLKRVGTEELRAWKSRDGGCGCEFGRFQEWCGGGGPEGVASERPFCRQG
ncbi:hypothetical protein GOBAR_DD18727 [Gossypium barbadense]|nr:hypothetical protein GOBAR_DD18727 [Gossypium barbadense]